MIIQGFLLLWAFALFFIILAEWASLRKYSLGVLAGLLFLLAGLYSLTDGIQIQNGEVRHITYATLQNATTNETKTYAELYNPNANKTTGNSEGNQTAFMQGTQIGNESIIYTYTDLAPQNQISFPFNELFGLMQVLVGIYLTVHYGLRLTS